MEKLDASKMPFVRSANNYDTMLVSNKTGLKCEDVSLAKQSFAEEADINTIVKRFGLTGQLPSDVRMPVSGDFTEITDFHQAMNAVRQAEESFMEMPAHVRARFNNDPGLFVDFCMDDNNREEAVKLGLVPPKAVPAAAPAAPTGASGAVVEPPKVP